MSYFGDERLMNIASSELKIWVKWKADSLLYRRIHHLYKYYMFINSKIVKIYITFQIIERAICSFSKINNRKIFNKTICQMRFETSQNSNAEMKI